MQRSTVRGVHAVSNTEKNDEALIGAVDEDVVMEAPTHASVSTGNAMFGGSVTQRKTSENQESPSA